MPGGSIERTDTIGGTAARRYIGSVNTRSIMVHLLKAILLSALAGGLAYGFTVWIEPANVSAVLVASTIAATVGLVSLLPHTLLESFIPRKKLPWSTDESAYHSLEFRLTNQTGNDALGYSPDEDDSQSI